MPSFALNLQPKGLFLVPTKKDGPDHHEMVRTAAHLTQPLIEQFDPKTMMSLPITAPSAWGEFLFGKITLCSWAGLGTEDIRGVSDAQSEEATRKAYASGATEHMYEIPDLTDMPMKFLLGKAENDEILHGPIIVARDAECVRGQINEIRTALGLLNLHPDSRLHVTVCRISGKNSDGVRDDQMLRDRVEPHWPLLSNGFPDVLDRMPLVESQNLAS